MGDFRKKNKLLILNQDVPIDKNKKFLTIKNGFKFSTKNRNKDYVHQEIIQDLLV